MSKPLALRLNFVDVVCDNSLKNTYVNGKPIGFEFDVRLSYYRGHFLSTIDELSVRIDGQEIASENIVFSLDGKDYGIGQLKSLVNVFWQILKPAKIKVFHPNGLEQGKHEVEFNMYFRSPYMEIGNGKYLPIDSCGKKELFIK